MRRSLYAHRLIRGEPAQAGDLLRRRVREILASAGNGVVLPDGALRMDLPARLFGMDVDKRVVLRTGVAGVDDGRIRIPLTWQATGLATAFPVFEGAIEWEALSSSHGQLSVIGAARIPFSAVGGAVDAMGLGNVADMTAQLLVDILAEGLRSSVAEQPPRPVPRALDPLPMRVRDVMTTDPLTLSVDLSLKTAAMLLLHFEVAGAPVVERDGTLVGVLSERDLLDLEATPPRALGRSADASWRRYESTTVGQACSRPAIMTTPGTSLAEAATMMRDRGIARLVVVDESRVVGIVSRHDVLRALTRSDTKVRADVQQVLDDLDEPSITVETIWGRAALHGRARTRTGARIAAERIHDVDGVLAVDREDLDWEVDDIVLAVPIT